MVFVFLLTCLISLEPVVSETWQEENQKAEARPIVIKSKSLEVDNKQKVVIFTGDVSAKNEDFVMDCQKMLVYYDSLPKELHAEKVEAQIRMIVATGQVKISRTKGGVATAEKAVYYQQDDEIVLTGKPIVRQGDDFLEGDRITLFLKENRSVVESGEDNKVKAVIFPKGEKR